MSIFVLPLFREAPESEHLAERVSGNCSIQQLGLHQPLKVSFGPIYTLILGHFYFIWFSVTFALFQDIFFFSLNRMFFSRASCRPWNLSNDVLYRHPEVKGFLFLEMWASGLGFTKKIRPGGCYFMAAAVGWANSENAMKIHVLGS